MGSSCLIRIIRWHLQLAEIQYPCVSDNDDDDDGNGDDDDDDGGVVDDDADDGGGDEGWGLQR